MVTITKGWQNLLRNFNFSYQTCLSRVSKQSKTLEGKYIILVFWFFVRDGFYVEDILLGYFFCSLLQRYDVELERPSSNYR